jgi:L-ascorbate metabolism protein UlaG (beta-lactamase superfamily)
MKTNGPVDVAFVGMGGIFTMNTEEALTALRWLQAKVGVPMHPLDASIDAFIAQAKRIGLGVMPLHRPGDKLII